MASAPTPAPSPAPASPSSGASAKLSVADRVLLALGFLCTTVITSYVGMVSQDRAAECQAIRTQRQADVQRFRDVAVGFDKPLYDYMRRAVNSGDTTTSRAAVIANLTDQRARLQYVIPYLDKTGVLHAQRMKDAIENFIILANKDPKGVQVAPLYKEYEYMLENGPPLLEATNRATGMESITLTSGRYWWGTLSCAKGS